MIDAISTNVTFRRWVKPTISFEVKSNTREPETSSRKIAHSSREIVVLSFHPSISLYLRATSPFFIQQNKRNTEMVKHQYLCLVVLTEITFAANCGWNQWR